jgi:hypothetical protein
MKFTTPLLAMAALLSLGQAKKEKPDEDKCTGETMKKCANRLGEYSSCKIQDEVV